ncbi:RNA polymerase factor sigma-54, partial [Escherichia coli]|uniref:RNA polymerase factor sigma-54 n=1 Tax=Escherichia coli TaxID=562 RepID=UPI003F74E68D
MARIAAGESADSQLRVLQRLSLDMDDRQLAAAAFWLDRCDGAGYLQAPLAQLQLLASAQFDIAADGVESIRQQLLHGEPAGMAAQDLREGLQAQLRSLQGVVPARPLAARILGGALDALAAHDYPALARQHDAEIDDVREAVRLILSLQPRPGDSLLPERNAVVVPD